MAVSALTESVGEGPISSVPRSSDEREIAGGLRAVVELQRAAALRMMARLLLFVAVPGVLLFSLPRLRFGEVPPGLMSEVGFLFVALVGASRAELPLALRSRLTVFGIVGFAVSSLLLAGPIMTTGLVDVVAILAAAFLLRRREAIATSVVLVAFVAVPLLGSFGLWGPAFHFPGPQLSQDGWVRLFLVFSAGAFGVLYVFLRIQRSLWHSFENEIAHRILERRLVAEREKILRRAASSQRLESLGRLAGGVAHDFNNALVVIQCGLETLQEGSAPEEEREILRDCAEAVDGAAATARQLLSFAAHHVEEVGHSNASTVLARIRKNAARLLPAHIELTVQVTDVPDVPVAEAVLEQLVLNLVHNARDALSEAGGMVTVSAEGDEESGGVWLKVADDGPGMPSEVAEHAFEPFFSTKGDQGVGLGLATVWGIVQRHGGEVTLSTEPGAGTTVEIRLPAAAADTESGPLESPSAFALTSPGPIGERLQRVLVLEDEPAVRAAIRRIFQSIGFEVVEAATAADARIAARNGRFDLLVSDGVVPDGGVGAFLQEFRARHRRVPIILCSGYLEEDLLLQGIARGEAVYLAKPFSAVQLVALVRDLLPEDAEPSGSIPPTWRN